MDEKNGLQADTRLFWAIITLTHQHWGVRMNPYGLRSLFDLLALNAQPFLKIAEIVTDYLQRTAAPELQEQLLSSQADYDETMQTLAKLGEHSEAMHLTVSARSMQGTLQQFSGEVPSVRSIREQVRLWYHCFNDELQSVTLFMILPHRKPYFAVEMESSEIRAGNVSGALIRALVNFRDARYDAVEAGACFSFGRFSACVYHLMRIAEHGLVSVSASLNIPDEKIGKGWDGCIQGIESAIKTISSTKPTTDWQDQVKKYSDLCSWFTTIKSGWRNPSSHVPRIYSEQSAAGIFSAVCTLFDHLNKYGFKQTKMPSDPLLLP